jgi:hypothetical protein
MAFVRLAKVLAITYSCLARAIPFTLLGGLILSLSRYLLVSIKGA